MRYVLRITMFLIAGGVIAVAVSWAIAVLTGSPALASGFKKVDVMGESSAADLHWAVFNHPGPGGKVVTGTARDAGHRAANNNRSFTLLPPDALPRWSGLHAGPDAEEAEYPELTVMVHATGWPFVAACYEVHGTRRWREGKKFEVDRLVAGMATEPITATGTIYDDLVAIPLRPIPAGLAIDTLVYAAALTAPLYAARALRRRSRRRRGGCPDCGYPAGPSPCPECGRGAAPATRPAYHHSGD